MKNDNNPKRYKARRSSSNATSTAPRRYRSNNYQADRYARLRPNKPVASPFKKMLSLMIIFFVLVLAGMLLYANNQNMLEEKFGKDSMIVKILSRLSLGNSSKNVKNLWLSLT